MATWTTDTSSDSNLSAGGKAAIDNGVAANSTSHQCVVTGLLPSTLYSCIVTSGGTSSSPQNVTTAASPTRFLVNSATMGGVSQLGGTQRGDTFNTVVGSDNNTYLSMDDGSGLALGGPFRNTQVSKVTNETTFAGVAASTLDNYGGAATTDGTDGPGGVAMTNKSTGIFAINGNLHYFVYRQLVPTAWRYCNWIKSPNFGATWNNFTAPSTFVANGTPVLPHSPAEPIQFYDLTIGLVSPVLYGKDDGTLGYNTAGNQIDGGNAYVYCTFVKSLTPLYLLRIPRIQFDAQTTSAFEYWVGPVSPAVADFVNDANWSASPTSATNILSGSQVGAWFHAAYVPQINTYIMTTWYSPGGGVSNFVFYSAPTPAGPWKPFFFQQNAVVHSEWYGPSPMHRDLAENTLTNNIPVRILYGGDPGGSNYLPNWSTLTLSTLAIASANFVQGVGYTSLGPNTQSMTLAFSSNVTLGNLLVVAWRRGTSGTVDTVSDNMGVGNTWTKVFDTNATGAFGGWAYTFTNGSGACTVTVHQTVSQANGILAVGEWSGVNAVRSTPAAFDQHTSNSPVTPSATPLENGELLLGFIVPSVGGGTSIAASTGATLRVVGANGATQYIAISDLFPAPIGGPQALGFTIAGAQTGLNTGIGDFYATLYAISGSAGIAGATVTYTLSGFPPGTVTADGSGNYSIPNLITGSYIVVPSLSGYTFTPANRTVNVINANVTGVNFTATASSGGAGTQGDMLTTNRWCTRLWG